MCWESKMRKQDELKQGTNFGPEWLGEWCGVDRFNESWRTGFQESVAVERRVLKAACSCGAPCSTASVLPFSFLTPPLLLQWLLTSLVGVSFLQSTLSGYFHSFLSVIIQKLSLSNTRGSCLSSSGSFLIVYSICSSTRSQHVPS